MASSSKRRQVIIKPPPPSTDGDDVSRNNTRKTVEDSITNGGWSFPLNSSYSSRSDNKKNNGGTVVVGGSKNNNRHSCSSDVAIGRIVFVGFLIVIAALLGWLGYLLLHNSETTLVDEQYYSMTSKALETVRIVSRNKLQLGTQTMANVAGHAFPNASSWPFVWIDGYWDILNTIIPTSLGTGMNLAPLVDPTVVNVSDFEDFVYGKFAENFPHYPNMGARSHFGKGIWVWDPSIDTVDQRYHDTTGISIHGSNRTFLAPKVQGEWAGVIDSEWVMMNVHGFDNQGKAVDAVMDCVEHRAKIAADVVDPKSINCQGLSPMQPSKPPQEHLGMFGFIATPVYPAHEPTKVVGFIFGLVYFSELLEAMYPNDFEGIDCVFTTEISQQVFTYTLQEGSGIFKGEGDLHDPKYDDYGMDTLLIDPSTMSNTSETYHCTCYPNDEFGLIYSTGAPIYAAVGAILIIIIISTLFLLYDRCVRREFTARKELLEAKRQFVRFVSHEVRTPLNSVGMGLTLMKDEMARSLGFTSSEVLETSDLNDLEGGGPNNEASAGKNYFNETKPAAKEWLTLADEIQNSAQSAVDVLNDLLNYDKIENGSLSLDLSVISIWELIDKTVVEFKLPMTSKGIKLQFQLPEQVVPKVVSQKVVGDTVRLTQVLRNLLSNAIKFTPENGDISIVAKWDRHVTTPRGSKHRKFEIRGGSETISCNRSGNLLLSVKDTGAGMSPEQLKKLFRKGVQFNVNELQHGNGSGLGLYISKGIVQQHEGQLICDSEGLGMGTTFTVTIPLYDFPQKEETQDVVEQMAEFDPTFEDSKLRILIVDDALSNRKLLGRLLSRKGHQTDQGEDGDVAVDMVKNAVDAGRPYDIVLMDYEMPKMNGPEAASIIRKNGSDVFIAGLTGNMMPEDIAYFHKCGANAILGKPFKMAELEELIFEHHIVGSIDPPQEEAAMKVEIETRDSPRQEELKVENESQELARPMVLMPC